MVGMTGLEPATSSSRTKRSTRLNYIPFEHRYKYLKKKIRQAFFLRFCKFLRLYEYNLQKLRQIHMNQKIKSKINNTFRALYQRNYRLFFIGQGISLIGSWIQNIAMSWLVYKLTQSAFLMGTITFINNLPSILVSPLAGVIIDRVNKYKMLICLQSLFLLQALILALLTLLGVIQIWHIVVIGVLTNVIAAFDMPLRQSLVINLVSNPKDLSNAISLNSSNFNLARLLGPAIAGVLIAKFSEGICFLINAISYLAVIWALLLMHLELPESKPVKLKNLKKEFVEGVNYAMHCPPIKVVLLFLAFVSFIGISYPLLMPIFANEILLGGATTLGILMSSSGIGALASSLFLASRKDARGLQNLIFYGAVIFALSFVSLGFIHNQTGAVIAMFFLGQGMIMGLISTNTLLQQVVDNDKRGRVMSLYTIAFIGTVPWGNLFAGTIAQKIGVSETFVFLGLLLLVVSFLFRSKTVKINFDDYLKN